MTYEELEQELKELVNIEEIPLLSWQQIADTLNGTLSND